ncbi:MAG: amino acid permease [Lewinellaceae bacterium]|nr:amino acid permease [Saprospiraceae bacterium]MCB9339978.1 amino acid permease [Lewinellaceae bacterium]
MDFKSLFRRKTIPSVLADLKAMELDSANSLVKNLRLIDLVAFGIAAIIGAGIFSTIGNAAHSGGPAVSLLFLFTAVACLFSALCYAEFASTIPISGSAYTYSYTVFGELVAWIIGWNLLMEYAIGNSTVAFSWSEYFTNLLTGVGLHMPDWLTNDYYTCSRATEGAALAVWQNAPTIGGLHIIFDLPAIFINILVTALVYIGIKETKKTGNMLVLLKMAVVLLVIVVGVFYVKPENWTPFAPNGMKGVLGGIAGVFFAYIGFDAISTTAEECKNPQKDLPRATVIVLIICSVLYLLVALVITGMVNYTELNVADPMAFIFEKYNLGFMAGIVSVSAVIAITSVFLVFQMGQPRIWMSMARDGLLPKAFGKIHPKYKTPSFATIMTGVVVALPTLLLNQEVVTDLCSIGTLFAFMLVSAGILFIDRGHEAERPVAFKVPYINGRFIVPALFVLCMVFLNEMPDDHNLLTGFSAEKVPYLLFFLTFGVLAVFSFLKNWSLIPVLGIVTNLYLIAGLGHLNWIRFGVWCAIGFVIYFLFSYKNSRLANAR